MLSSPGPEEAERLAALRRYAILDTATEQEFDELAWLASSICGAPIALISLVDDHRQWFKAHVGIDASETPREISFCAHAIRENDLFIVSDARLDARFADNPLVTGPPHVRFYAAAQLSTPEGLNLGTICVVDHQPRNLAPEQRLALRALARQVMVQMELRRQIAERKVTERKLRDSESLFRSLADGAPIGIFLTDDNGYCEYTNPRWQELSGQTYKESLGRGWSRAIHEGDQERVFESWQRAVAEDREWEAFYRLNMETGERLALSRAARVRDLNRWVGTVLDVTEQTRAEQELRRSEARTRSIIENALGGLITTNEKGIIESVNPAALRMFGHAEEAMIGRPVSILLATRYRSDRECLRHLRDEALNRVSEWRGRRADGSTFDCELSLFEFYTGDDQRHFAAHMLDVSARQEVERMKKDFVATVSHELRTPLTSVRGSLGLLASGVMGELTPDAKKLVSIAERNSVRLITLINDILDFEKLESGSPVIELGVVPVQRVLERSVETIAAFAQQEGVTIEVGSSSLFAIGDEARLTQVCVNLLSNAVKFSHAGGVVRIEASAEGESIQVQVVDRGRGIAKAMQARLFQRFSQIDAGDARSRNGTGLGLAICRAIVEQHGGSIGAESEEGVGSCFWFRVPAADPAEPRETERPDLLLIGGDRSRLALLTQQLGADGVSVISVSGGAAALRLLRDRSPRAVLIDAQGTDDGAALLRLVRSDTRNRSLPVVLSSMAAESDGRESADGAIRIDGHDLPSIRSAVAQLFASSTEVIA